MLSVGRSIQVHSHTILRHLQALHTLTMVMSEDTANSVSTEDMPYPISCITSILSSDLDPPLDNEASGFILLELASAHVDDILNDARNDDCITLIIL